MGIAIGPLLAGAGVVGIAVGLGAQSTIADVLSGVFFLLEDAFHIGDYVEVGNLRGTVEGISLRSLKLRHHRGAVHTLPFGQIKALTNLTRDWSLMRLEFRVAPDTDLALVKRVIKGISKELQADPEMGPSFI
jgi:small-conductance mechanosensitive channel